MKIKFKTLCAAIAVTAAASGCSNQFDNNYASGINMQENIKLETKWDKVFPQSDKVNHSKVTFHNRYGVTLVADMYVPKNAKGKLPAIAVRRTFRSSKRAGIGTLCPNSC